MTDLLGDTIARLKERAADPQRRSDEAELAATSVSAGDMLAGLPNSSDPAVHEYLAGMNSPFAGMIGNLVAGDGGQAKGLLGALGQMLGGNSLFGLGTGADGSPQPVSFGVSPKASHAPSPCTEAEIAASEAELGFALPADLRTFYLEVANGGVGPGSGLYSLDQLTSKWSELTHEPVGPRGQKWPAKLLPIEGAGWDVVTIDRDSGALIRWDIEEIDYGGWKKSFIPEADSLESWLDRWLAKPSLAEKAKKRAERPAPRQLSDEDWRVWGEQDPRHAEYLRRLGAFSATPAERAAMGLPEQGWELKVWDGFDRTAIKFPTPGHADRNR
jgi:hypothetical protein